MAVNDATAFLVHEDAVFFTRAEVVPTPNAPFTPLTALIEGIWNQNPEFANKILRNHLYSFYERTPLCDGMIKVAAKRARLMTEFESYEFFEDERQRKWIEVFPSVQIQNSPLINLGDTATPKEAIQLVKELMKNGEQRENRFESDRPVGGLLLSSNNKVLASGWNSNAKNRVHHCEVNLLRNYLIAHGKKIPVDSQLIVSLKPCAMCAAQLLTFSEDFTSLKVLYLEDDLGPAAKNSVLMQGSDLWKKAGSPSMNLVKL